jgi:hypothetical protein
MHVYVHSEVLRTRVEPAAATHESTEPAAIPTPAIAQGALLPAHIAEPARGDEEEELGP